MPRQLLITAERDEAFCGVILERAAELMEEVDKIVSDVA
jgi:hypothetical protein